MSTVGPDKYVTGAHITGELILDEPVFVLTCARSGSTLLRMILDAHPELACPPETNIAKLCLQLWDMWAVLDPRCTKSVLTEQARAHIRGTVDAMFGSYLASRGKTRWCEKSLGTSNVADRFLGVFEKAKFICLYRHAMDVISSAVDASPWGLCGYGFDRYTRPGLNSVSALVNYWLEGTEETLEFEEEQPGRCLRVYYEELVTDPERVAAEIFDFIGVAPAPGITGYALRDQERPDIFGSGDHKIRSFNSVSDTSVGRGIRVPANLISQTQVAALNQVLGRLGYTEVNRAWQLSACPPALLSRPLEAPSGSGPGDDGEKEAAGQQADPLDTHPQLDRFEDFDSVITRRISRTLPNLPATLQIWDAVGIVAYSLAAPRIAQAWRVDCPARKLMSDQEVDFDALNVDWLLTGEIDAWLSVLSGADNLSAAVRHGAIRCIGREMTEDSQTGQVRGFMDLRIRMLTHLLELGTSGLD